MDNEFFYFQRRAEEELDAALRTGHPKARQAHLDLAELHSRLASALIGEKTNKDRGVALDELGPVA